MSFNKILIYGNHSPKPMGIIPLEAKIITNKKNRLCTNPYKSRIKVQNLYVLINI